MVDSPLSWRKTHQQAYHTPLSFSLASIPKNENSPLKNQEFGLVYWRPKPISFSALITFSLSPHLRKCLNTKLWDNTGCRHILFIHSWSFSFLFSTNSSPNLPWRKNVTQYFNIWTVGEWVEGISHIKRKLHKVIHLLCSPVICLSGNGGIDIHVNFSTKRSNNQSKCLYLLLTTIPVF